MDNDDKGALAMVLVAVVTIAAAVLVGLFYVNPTTELIPTSELPYGYEVYNLRSAGEGIDGVRLSTTLNFSVNRTIPVAADEIEVSYFILSEEKDNISFKIRDKSRNGEWKIFFSFVNNTREEVVSWTSRVIEVGETVTFPTEEKVTLLGFDSEGNPLFEVFE